MTNIKFSSHDLIGAELNKPQHQDKLPFYFRLLDLIIPDSKTCDFEIRIPTYLYLRIMALVEFICEEYEIQFDLGTFIWILYRDFLGRAYKYNNQADLYNFISSMDRKEVDIVDYRQSDSKNKKEKQKEKKIVFSLSKKEALKGELVLGDLYEAFSYHVTLEKVIEMHIIHFIKEYKKGNLPGAVTDIVNYCKKNIS